MNSDKTPYDKCNKCEKHRKVLSVAGESKVCGIHKTGPIKLCSEDILKFESCSLHINVDNCKKVNIEIPKYNSSTIIPFSSFGETPGGILPGIDSLDGVNDYSLWCVGFGSGNALNKTTDLTELRPVISYSMPCDGILSTFTATVFIEDIFGTEEYTDVTMNVAIYVYKSSLDKWIQTAAFDSRAFDIPPTNYKIVVENLNDIFDMGDRVALVVYLDGIPSLLESNMGARVAINAGIKILI